MIQQYNSSISASLLPKSTHMGIFLLKCSKLYCQPPLTVSPEMAPHNHPLCSLTVTSWGTSSPSCSVCGGHLQSRQAQGNIRALCRLLAARCISVCCHMAGLSTVHKLKQHEVSTQWIRVSSVLIEGWRQRGQKSHLSRYNHHAGFLALVAYTFSFLGPLPPCESHTADLLQIIWLYTTDIVHPGLHQLSAWLGTQPKNSQTSFLLWRTTHSENVTWDLTK